MGGKLVVISFKIDEDTLAELDRIASESGISRSEIIRKAIASYISRARTTAREKPMSTRVVTILF